MKKKQGISLIVLMITIIVIIVLAAAVIMALNKNNPFNAANEALFKNDLKSIAEKVNLEILTESIKDQNIINRVIQGDEVYEKYAPEAKDKYKVYIEKGELTINANDYTEEEVRWAKEARIRIGYLPVIEEVELTSTETSVTANVKMKTTGDYTYKYKIIGTGANDSWIDKKEATNTFSELKTGTEYTVEVKVEEKREGIARESDVVTKSITTKGISELVDILPSTTEWVQKLTVKLTHSNIPTGYKLEYKINSGEWKEYTQDIELATNCTVKARVYNSILSDAVGETSLDITNIDEVVPTAPTGITIVSKTENNIVVKANGSTDTLSGLVGYQYSIDNTNWSATTNGNYTINNIKSGTEVTVYAKAIDKVGLESSVYSSKGTTDVVNGTVNYSFNPGLGSYVNSNIAVTLTATVPSGYELQYKIDSGSWTKYTSPFTVTQNGNIKTRIYNATVNDEIVGTSQDITNIDKVAPTAPTIVSMTSNTVNSITVQASGATDSISGVVGYQYSTDNTNWSATTNTSYVINGIKAGTNVTVYARAVDRVNLVSTSKSQVLSTQGVTDVVSLNPNITNWTNGDVTVTLSHSNIPSGYVMQYKLGAGSFVTGNSVVVTSNIKVTGRLYNASIDDEIAGASLDITNIDKIASSVPNVAYISGSNTCSWKNNYNINLSSTDSQSGVNRYQIDYNMDGVPDRDIGPNFIPENGYHSCTNRFRSVDNVGNVSAWTDVHHIHMDTVAPTLTNWWWAGVSNEVATLYIQASDNASGIIRVQTPASSEVSGFSDWVWHDAVWDAGANAYRAQIPVNSGRYGNYKVHLYMYDNAGNGGMIAESGTVNIPQAVPSNYTDSDGKTAFIPKGFEVSKKPGEQNVNTGLVIVDPYNGNEFVWIPVEYTSESEFTAKFVRKEGYWSGILQEYLSKGSTEPNMSNQSEIDEYNAMYASVKKYHGYYIARYEASGAENTVLSRANWAPWVSIYWANSNTDLSGGAVEKARIMYPVSSATQGSAVTTLIYGVQWDVAIDFIENYGVRDKTYKIDSNGKGYYGSSKTHYTGNYEGYALNNIYDMAGNAGEWTMESYNGSRIKRGGSCNSGGIYSGSIYPVSNRIEARPNYSGYEPGVTAGTYGFRVALYVK